MQNSLRFLGCFHITPPSSPLPRWSVFTLAMLFRDWTRSHSHMYTVQCSRWRYAPNTRRRNRLCHLLTFRAVGSVCAPTLSTSKPNGVLFITNSTTTFPTGDRAQPCFGVNMSVGSRQKSILHFLVYAQWSPTHAYTVCLWCQNTPTDTSPRLVTTPSARCWDL